MLRLNLEHHLSWGIDHIGVCDHCSRDDTARVVRSFGKDVTSITFTDFSRRQAARMECLLRIRDRFHCTPQWVGVSDTDEFFWAADRDMRAMLDDVPPDVAAATFHQKLYLPTEVDPPDGRVFERQLYRTARYDSRLHRSYREGKSVYRGAWLARITSEHRCPEVPHPEWSPWPPIIHHYMVRDEDQFVRKVRRLASWRPHDESTRARLVHALRSGLGFAPPPPFVAEFKLRWWEILRNAGEEELRRHYRTQYQISRHDLTAHLKTGELLFDDAFARWNARHRPGHQPHRPLPDDGRPHGV